MSETEKRELLDQVRRAIEESQCSLPEAASSIGVTLASLQRHLGGAYVRSDSLAKYRAWLQGAAPQSENTGRKSNTSPASDYSLPYALPDLVDNCTAPSEPYLVVDLFSGCGGMSLGFDEFEGGSFFETVLAIDVEESMLDVFNANRGAGCSSPAVGADLSDFLNEAEVLAFYLSHIASRCGDFELASALDELPGGGLSGLRAEVRRLDRQYLRSLAELRSAPRFAASIAEIDSVVFRQTSVLDFHVALGIPLPTNRQPRISALWAGDLEKEEADGTGTPRARRLEALAIAEWNERLEELRQKASGAGRGQLASSSRKISIFLEWLGGGVGDELREIWISWRSRRLAVRMRTFETAEHELRRLYEEGRRVAVLLGGPPCQGFSRIGRGKIRSLQDSGVHATADSEVGDQRNRLMEAYILWVSALRPDVFLFENVRHFKAEVKTPSGVFLASEALAASIADMSDEGLHYSVDAKVIRSHDHGVPQTRERYFMAGVQRTAASVPESELDIASWILSLPFRPPVPLRTALEGLPEASLIERGKAANLAARVPVNLHRGPSKGAEGEFLDWVRSDGRGDGGVDAHIARPPREDDSAWFSLMGPGKRWMDYRCDRSDTLERIASAISILSGALSALEESEGDADHPALKWLEKLSAEEASELGAVLDGSLSLRLLLEAIPAHSGELHHHLLTPAYLAKREGNHGDWVARLDPTKPCKTVMSHMGKDTYAYVHPWSPRTISVREAARVQTFPDWFDFGAVGFVDALRIIGNAVPPLLSRKLADRVAQVLELSLGE